MSVARPSMSERRREKRYQVDLPGAVQADRPGAQPVPVKVTDLSATGALIDSEASDFEFRAGEKVFLYVEEFGLIGAQVAHVGSQFYGLQFLSPHLLRDRLWRWLGREIGAA